MSIMPAVGLSDLNLRGESGIYRMGKDFSWFWFTFPLSRRLNIFSNICWLFEIHLYLLTIETLRGLNLLNILPWVIILNFGIPFFVESLLIFSILLSLVICLVQGAKDDGVCPFWLSFYYNYQVMFIVLNDYFTAAPFFEMDRKSYPLLPNPPFPGSCPFHLKTT